MGFGMWGVEVKVAVFERALSEANQLAARSYCRDRSWFEQIMAIWKSGRMEGVIFVHNLG